MKLITDTKDRSVKLLTQKTNDTLEILTENKCKNGKILINKVFITKSELKEIFKNAKSQ